VLPAFRAQCPTRVLHFASRGESAAADQLFGRLLLAEKDQRQAQALEWGPCLLGYSQGQTYSLRRRRSRTGSQRGPRSRAGADSPTSVHRRFDHSLAEQLRAERSAQERVILTAHECVEGVRRRVFLKKREPDFH